MRAGKLDRQIVIQTATITQSDSGEQIETWVSLPTRPASYTPVRGDERYSGEQVVGADQVEFRIRWADAVAGIDTRARVIYPGSSASDSPIPENAIYDVLAIQEIGRREGLIIMASRRFDV